MDRLRSGACGRWRGLIEGHEGGIGGKSGASGAGAGYSSGGQQNFAPYTMIGLAWLLAQKALNAEDRDEYEAVFYEPVGTAGTLQRMLYARRCRRKRTRGR